MKNIILAILLVFVSQSLPAQDYNHVCRMEFELGIGLNKGNTLNGGVAKVGHHFYLEPRFNIINTPFDIGLQATIGRFRRTSDLLAEKLTHKCILLVCSDYNWRKWKSLSLFAGLGAGMAFVKNDATRIMDYGSPGGGWGIDNDIYDGKSFVVNPRIGAEFFNHLRVTLEYKWMRKPYSYFALNIGGVFGGGLKK